MKFITDNPCLMMGLFGLGLLFLIMIRYALKSESHGLTVLIGHAQITGKRAEQEDSFATVTNAHGTLAVLADGMGGYSDGKLASETVVNTFAEQFSNGILHGVKQFFQTTARLCNDRILKMGQGNKAGSTLAAVVVTESQLDWVSIGDSAIMMHREGELSNLNKKHNFQAMLEERYQSGKITKAELINNPKKKRLTSYLGNDGFREIAMNDKPINLLGGDKIILCSDGIYNSISELEIEKILTRNLKPAEAAACIISKITDQKISNQDNATIIILQIVKK